MNVAVIGSRTFKPLDRVKKYLMENLSEQDTIITGGASGVDTIAMEVARLKGLRLIVYYPAWQVHGKKAGLLRNYAIVSDADEVWAFWDGKSRGTLHTIGVAQGNKKKYTVWVADSEDLTKVDV